MEGTIVLEPGPGNIQIADSSSKTGSVTVKGRHQDAPEILSSKDREQRAAKVEFVKSTDSRSGSSSTRARPTLPFLNDIIKRRETRRLASGKPSGIGPGHQSLCKLDNAV